MRGFKGAMHKSFKSQQEAAAYVDENKDPSHNSSAAQPSAPPPAYLGPISVAQPPGMPDIDSSLLYRMVSR